MARNTIVGGVLDSHTVEEICPKPIKLTEAERTAHDNAAATIYASLLIKETMSGEVSPERQTALANVSYDLAAPLLFVRRARRAAAQAALDQNGDRTHPPSTGA